MQKAFCEWTYEGLEDYWATACGNKHVFIDGGPVDNKHKFCPYCGNEIHQFDEYEELLAFQERMKWELNYSEQGET